MRRRNKQGSLPPRGKVAEAPPEADEASVPQLPIHEMHWQALPHQSAYADSFPRGGSLRDAKKRTL